MITKLTKQNRGFTIIEVMIVLAIAGLILAIVFLAVPSLQRNARNNSRINDASHLGGLVNEFVANHTGQLPATICSTAPCAATAVNITSENWAIVATPATVNSTSTANYGAADGSTIVVNEGWQCKSGALSSYAAGSKSFAIGYNTENSGGFFTTCIQG